LSSIHDETTPHPPYHVRFVQERWLPEVAEFMEIDYIAHQVAAAP
jgi:hypothetical protein